MSGYEIASLTGVESLPGPGSLRWTPLRKHFGITAFGVNAGLALRAPHVLSVGIAGIRDGAALLMALDLEGIAVSGGSACLSGAAKRSHVMAALYGESDDHATIRFSFGRSTTEEDVERAADATVRVVEGMKSSLGAA